MLRDHPAQSDQGADEADVGLDRDEVLAALAAGTYAADVEADIAQARTYGISGVPFFVLDGQYGVSGAQPADVLREVLDKAWSERTPVQLVPAGGAAPGCDGDSCAV